MKYLFTCILLLFSVSLYSQIDNQLYHQRHNQRSLQEGSEIYGNGQLLTIVTEAVYNAVPDGYHVTYTTSFIGNSIEQVEDKMNKKIDSLSGRVRKLGLTTKDVTVDVIALDPLFDFRQGDSFPPIGYKVTENITFHIRSVAVMGELAKICLDFGIYDLINAQAYLLDSDPVYDSLNAKTVELLNEKKAWCADIGIALSGSKVEVTRYKEVFYPSERYLKAYLQNPTFYKHHASQNSTLSMDRRVDVDNYYDLNLKDADYVFHSDNEVPCIQFYYRLVCVYTKTDTEEELRAKILKEQEEKQEKQFYILDQQGNLKKIEI